ncbi:hypothetical protein GJAV_G00087350 [Gymnothorax javanicus]|nr:hypothetical protein GJAV_G00087350 [Gymnothorax javanicus]
MLHNQNVVKLTDLLNTYYITALEETQFANPEFRSRKLKGKLEHLYRGKIALCKLESKGEFITQVVYNADMKLVETVQKAFLLDNKDTLTEIALYLRNVILDAFDKSDDLRWPPTVDYIPNTDDVLPQDLRSFLSKHSERIEELHF